MIKIMKNKMVNLRMKNENRKKIDQIIDSHPFTDYEYKNRINNLVNNYLNMKPLILIILFLGIVVNISGQYSLVWQDEFNGNSLDESKWNYVTQIGVWNTGDNKELQHYKKENVTVGQDDNGNNCLIISAKKEEYNGYHFTSGRIDTRNKFSFKYGKLEARIKMPDLANGLWPAFWTLGTQQIWPACGEIDILEMGHKQGITDGTQNKYMGGALHWENNDTHAMYYKNITASSNLNDDYHIFTLEWTPSYIKLYLDSLKTMYFVMNMPSSDGEEFTDYLHYIIFNLAIGGSLPGVYSIGEVTAPLPANMYVDWVRVYQKADEGEINVGIKGTGKDIYGLGIFPNPTYSYINIIGITGIVSISIYDSNGKMLKIMKDIQSNIDVSDLSPGAYFIEASNAVLNRRTKFLKL
jgi:beta-glucanase (GH16 family)